MDLQTVKAKAAHIGARAAVMATSAVGLAAMSVPAFASESGGGSASITSIVSAADTVSTMTTNVFSMIAGNPLLATFAASGLIGVGVTTFKRLKRASR